MEFNFEMTGQARLLLGILVVVLLVVFVIQGGSTFYGLLATQDINAKKATLANAENLIHIAKILSPIESELYKDTGLGPVSDNPDAVTIFFQEHPETIIRQRVDELIKRAGINQNYQLRTKLAPGKKTIQLGAPERQRLVLYLYVKHLESELKQLEELEVEENPFSELMDAWFGEGEPPKNQKTEGTDDSKKIAEKIDGETPVTVSQHAQFARLPEAIPLSIRIELVNFIHSMISQELLGAADFRRGFLESQIHEKKSTPRPGFFGIGAKPATVEIQFRPDSELLDVLTTALQAHTGLMADAKASGDIILAIVNYASQIQEQQTALLTRLNLAPPTYQFDTYVVEMKFRTAMEKLVNLNHLIETRMKWLSIKDLRITVDKQENLRSNQRRGGSQGRSAGKNETMLSVNVVMIAKIF